MQNENYRKYTSLTLMAIMVAGGLTFAIPGTAPVAYAAVDQTNANLYVSAEGQDADNQFAEGNIIEVIILDSTIGDTGESEAEPTVTVNGADLRMLQTGDGNWRAYFAQADALADIDDMNGQLDYGVHCSASDASTVSTIPLSDTNGVYFPPGSVNANCAALPGDTSHPLIRETRTLTDWNPAGDTIGQLGLANENLWPFIQVFDFASQSDVRIVYEKGGQQTVTLTLDDPSESHSLNSERYPQSAHVLVTINDYALNIDPTDEDMWAFDTQNGAAYYNLFDEDGTPDNIMDSTIVDYAGSAGIDEQISIVRNGQGGDPLINCQVTKDFGIQDASNANMDYLVSNDDSNGACVPTDNITNAAAGEIFTADNFVIGFVEDGSNNDAFINWAEDQRSNLVVRDNADRNRSFEIDYSSPGAISGIVSHFFADMSIDVEDGVWNSGERVPFTLTDADANVNPLAEDNLEVANPKSKLIPSIKIGEPITLATAGNVEWLDLDSNAPQIRINGSNTVSINQGETYTDDGASCVDGADGTLEVSTSGTVDSSSPDTYTVTYTCTDSSGNTSTATRTVTVEPDRDQPTIVLNGRNPLTQTVATTGTYTDAGATCTDTTDGTISTSATFNNVSVTTVGEYIVTYECTDSSGNVATLDRVVNIVEADDVPPTIDLDGITMVSVIQNDPYVDRPVTCTDNVDGNLTSSIVTTGLPVDTSVIANTTVTYKCTDASNNTATASRTVSVIENDVTAPTIAITADNTQVYIGDTYVDAGATCIDLVDGNLTSSIVTTGLPLDTSASGPQSVTYSCVDAKGNQADETRTVTVMVDTTDPVIVIAAGNRVITAGQAYVPPTATCTDHGRPHTTITNDAATAVDNNVPDTYTVTYTCTDSAGNTDMKRIDVTVNPKPPSIDSLDISVGGWEDGELQLHITGSSTNLKTISLTWSIDNRTIAPIFFNEDGTIDDTEIITDSSVYGKHNITLTASSEVSETVEVTIPRALELTRVTADTTWTGTAENSQLELLVRGSSGLGNATITLDAVDGDERIFIGAVDFGDRSFDRVKLNSSEGLLGDTEFVLTHTEGAESVPQSTNIPPLLELTDVNAKWNAGNLVLTLEGKNYTQMQLDGTTSTLTLEYDDGTVLLPDAENGIITANEDIPDSAANYFKINSTAIYGQFTILDALKVSGMTLDLDLLLEVDAADDPDDTDAYTPPIKVSKSVEIPPIFKDVVISPTGDGTWDRGQFTLNVAGTVTGLADNDVVKLFVLDDDNFVAVHNVPDSNNVRAGDGILGSSIVMNKINISGDTFKFRLHADDDASGSDTDFATSKNVSIPIPPLLTLTNVEQATAWDGNQLVLDVTGSAGFPLREQSGNNNVIDQGIQLRAYVSNDTTGDFTDVDVAVNGTTGLKVSDSALTGNVSTTDIALSGKTVKFFLTYKDAITTNPATTENTTAKVMPTIVELTDVSVPTSWSGTGTDSTIEVTVKGSTIGFTNTASGEDVLLAVEIDGEFVQVGTTGFTINNDGSILDQVTLSTTTLSLTNADDLEKLVGNNTKFQLRAVTTTSTATSNTVSAKIPALTAETASVEMTPTLISFFASHSGFPPITRAVIGDVSEIPAVHNVQMTYPKTVYTWTVNNPNDINDCDVGNGELCVEKYSERLRLAEPTDMMDLGISGNSKIVIHDWQPPADNTYGVITMFNWNFDGIPDVTVSDIRIANVHHNVSYSVGTGSSGLTDITDMVSDINALGDTVDLVIMLNGDVNHVCDDITLVADFFSFGQTPDGERVNNAIYRIEVEEASTNSDEFEGTVEYVMLNQLNYDDPATYSDLRTISDEVLIVINEDFTDEDAVRINYLDLGADGVSTQISTQEDAATYSGIVTFDQDSYKVADTVIITVDDADLNVDNDVIDIYTFSTSLNHTDKIGSDSDRKDAFLLDVTFDDELWTGNAACTIDKDGNTADVPGFASTTFTLAETTRNSGIFTGDFQIPEYYCQETDKNNDKKLRESVTGTDIEVNYQDFRDASGNEIEVGAGAAVRASTGTVSLDRTVYPVPFEAGVIKDADGNELKNVAGNDLQTGDLTVYVHVTDPDYDVSAAGEDTMPADTVSVSVIRGSQTEAIAISDSTITEVAPDAGVFKLPLSISYDDGPAQGCPQGFTNGCILQGDILQVEYEDPTDASGEANTVTDSATFDLRNGVLQSDKSVYIIGSDMILTLIEPDFDLDGDSAETYTLDLIEWDSDAATVAMGSDSAFDPEPNGLRETGDNTGIFQSVIEIPSELANERLDRGEEIELEYVDYGPSGSDYVGDETEDITLTVFTSNFGATIELDQKVYTWTDKVYITIVAPDHNFDGDLVDEIGDSDDDPVKVSTRSADIDNYKLVETGPDTGIFTGEIILIGFDHNADGNTQTGTESTGYDNPQKRTSDDGSGPTDGFIETDDDDGITVSFEFSEDETVVGSALIRWNIGEVQWLESSYPASGTGVVRVIDPDMNLNPEAVDNFEVDIWSDRDQGGIDLTVTETNQATGIFEGTVFFTTSDDSSGHRLRVAESNTVTAEYEDNTLPEPYNTGDELNISATTLIGTQVPPLERAPISNLRIVDAHENSIDTVAVDQQVQVVADLVNGQDRTQEFAYLVQIQDESGVTVSLAWISGTLEAEQSLTPSASWIPTEAGEYTATAFVWESIDTPTALSPPATITITVN